MSGFARSALTSRNPALNPAKIWLDRSAAVVAILLLAPLLIIIAAAIKLEGGRVLFRQRRTGLGGRPFHILKFRTMHSLEDGPEVRQATRDDARVTRVGRFLRRTSLDELPQLFNVVKGEMSLVGPRPHALAHDTYYAARIARYADRHSVRPGLTGWAQVNGSRGETPTIGDMSRRVEHDLWYIANWSLLLDAKILLRTVCLLCKSDPAAC